MDFAPFEAVFRRDQADCRTFAAVAGGAADAVDVIFRALRQVVIDDVLDMRNVETTRCDVGGNQDAELLVAERLNNAFALALVQVAMDGVGE